MKKGQMGAIVGIILVVIIAIIVLSFLIKLFVKYEGEGTVEICKSSVLAQAEFELGGSSVLSLECKRRYIDIHPTYVDFGNEPEKMEKMRVYTSSGKKKSFSSLDNDIVNGVIANEIKTCWYQFGEAKTEIFPNNEKITEAAGDLLGSEDDICFTCSEIEFIDVEKKEFRGLTTYLKTTNIPNTKYTYWDYLNQESLSEHTLEQYMQDCYSGTFEDLWDDNPFIFKTDETYAVIFYKDYDDSVSNMIKYYSPQYIAGKVVGYIITPTCTDTGGKSGYYVLVVPTKNLDDICEIQAG